MVLNILSLDSLTLSNYRGLFSHAPDFNRIHGSKNAQILDELYDFYKEATRQLSSIILKLYDDNLLKPDGRLRLYYALTGHGMTYTNLRGELTGNLGSMLICPSDNELWAIAKQLNKDASGQEIDAIVKQAIDMGSQLAIRQHQDITPDCVIFSSDIPRALHHAILKYDPSKEAELQEIALKPQVKMGVIDQEDYIRLVNMAIDTGIIPTPLLRAQFFGEGEMMGSPRGNRILEAFKQNRRDLSYRISNPEGSASESYVHFCFDRGFEFLRMLANEEGVFIGNADLVTHSGFFDIARAYFRYLETRDKVILGRTKTEKSRGSTFTIKVDAEASDNGCTSYFYANDPSRLDKILRMSSDSMTAMRQSSLDKLIREEEQGAIMPVEMIGFRINQGNIFPYSVTIDELTQYALPVLLLGHVGQGKTMAAINIYTHFLKTSSYIPIIISAKEINSRLHNRLTDDASENSRVILETLTRGVSSLPEELRDECIVNGKPGFVFIIDALDELGVYRENIIQVIKEVLPKYGKVILTSRFTGFEKEHNDGFSTLNLDELSVIHHLESYLKSRGFTEEERGDLTSFINKQDSAIKGSYLMIHFLTEMYKRDPESLYTWKGPVTPGQILLDGIENILFSYRQAKDPSFQQKPRPQPGQDEEKYKKLVRDYERERSIYLFSRVKFLSRIAGYMTLREKDEITREEIEESCEGLAVNYQQEKEGNDLVYPGFDYENTSVEELLRDVEPILKGDKGAFRFTHRSFQEYHTADELVWEIEDFNVPAGLVLRCCLEYEVEFDEDVRQKLREKGVKEDKLPTTITTRRLKPWARPVLLNMFDTILGKEGNQLMEVLLACDPVYYKGLKIKPLLPDYGFAELCLEMTKRNPGNLKKSTEQGLAGILISRYLIYGETEMDNFKHAAVILGKYNLNIVDVMFAMFEATAIYYGVSESIFDLTTNFFSLSTRALIEVGNLEEAMKAAESGDKYSENPQSHSYFYLQKAIIHAKQGDKSRLNNIKGVVQAQNHPNYISTMLQIADTLFEIGDHEDALELYNHIAKLEPISTRRLVMDSFPYEDIREDTIRHFDSRKDIARVYLHMGIIYEIRGNHENAEEAFISAVRERDYTHEAHFRLAELYNGRGVQDKADLHYLLALSHCNQRDIDQGTHNQYFSAFSGVLSARGINNPMVEISKLAAEKEIKIRRI